VTLPPIELMYLVKGIEGEHYKVGPRCSNPACRRFADHAHHIFRRSALGGPFDWVQIADYITGNLTGLCARCHDEVTGGIGGHTAAIRFAIDEKVFYWCRVEGPPAHVTYHRTAPLDPQPPTPSSLEATPGQGTESEHCPVCGAARRRKVASPSPSPAGLPRRRRKNWIVSVPDDSEQGAEILDLFVDDVADLLGAGDWEERNRRYWALVHALSWVMQHREEFELDVKAVEAA
jgi:hypothetical protein